MIQRKKGQSWLFQKFYRKMHVTISCEYYFVLENSFTLEMKILFCTSLTKAEIFCENGGSILLWLGEHTVTKDGSTILGSKIISRYTQNLHHLDIFYFYFFFEISLLYLNFSTCAVYVSFSLRCLFLNIVWLSLLLLWLSLYPFLLDLNSFTFLTCVRHYKIFQENQDVILHHNLLFFEDL